MKLTDKQLEIMGAEGHLLVEGGPGSGKTTVSILKAAQIAKRDLSPGQKILFLSFARATVSRIVEAIEYEHKVPLEQRRRIDVETYHSFFWRVLKAHGYLLGLPRRLTILTPPGEAIALSDIRLGYTSKKKLTEVEKAEKKATENTERRRLAREEGRVCFDLYAPHTSDILHGSTRIRKLVATMYPVIILDEFQDTNDAQWRVVQALGEFSTLFALADPEQRIFDWIGADPERLSHFRETFAPTEIDLSIDNHRSAGTDIATFGNNILTSKFREDAYSGVQISRYQPNAAQAYASLVAATYKARRRLAKSDLTEWSLAILVPTKRLTRLVSDAFHSPPAEMARISHTAVIELEGAILAAEIIALLMQPDTDGRRFEHLIDLIQNYFLGKGGDTPTKAALAEANGIRKAYEEYLACRAAGKGLRRNSVLVQLLAVYDQTGELDFSGNPDNDWRAVRCLLENGTCARLKEIAKEVRNLRILGRGTQLRQGLSQDWRDNGAYRNALAVTQQAFMQDHFATKSKPEIGVVVMNMHKAKGKQFDEVIVFEGWPIKRKGQPPYNADRIVRFNSLDNADDHTRQNLRVSVTRAKRHATILTPKNDPCVLLLNAP